VVAYLVFSSQDADGSLDTTNVLVHHLLFGLERDEPKKEANFGCEFSGRGSRKVGKEMEHATYPPRATPYPTIWINETVDPRMRTEAMTSKMSLTTPNTNRSVSTQ
jgi:hypothetical protein